MAELIERLPRADRRLLDTMAADAGSTAEEMAREMVRAYLSLVRSAPDAMPYDPLRRGVQAVISRGV